MSGTKACRNWGGSDVYRFGSKLGNLIGFGKFGFTSSKSGIYLTSGLADQSAAEIFTVPVAQQQDRSLLVCVWVQPFSQACTF